MLLEQVLHIMLNQDYPRSVIISTANIWTFALRCISENGKYGGKVMQTFAKPLFQPITETISLIPQHYNLTLFISS